MQSHIKIMALRTKSCLTKDGVFLLLTSIAYALFTLKPFKSWIRTSDFSAEPFPDVHIYQDAIYYLGQIREVINRNYSIGNPFLFEHSQDGFSYGNSSLFLIWGIIGDLLNFNVIQTYLIMIIINSMILIVFLTLLYKNFSNFKVACLASLVTCALLIGPLGRPSPTEQLLPILLLAIILILPNRHGTKIQHPINRNFKNLLFLFCAIILVTGNQFYSLFLLTLVTIVSFAHIKARLFQILVVMSLNLTYFLWTKIGDSSSEELIATRLGLHYTRVPGALDITIPVASFLFVTLYFYLNQSTKFLEVKNSVRSRIKVFVFLNLALLISVNSQVITGMALEMESHFRLIWLTYIALYMLFFIEILQIKMKNLFLFLKNLEKLGSFAICTLIILLISQFKPIPLVYSDRTKFIQYIQNDSQIKSVLIKTDSPFYNFRDQVILLTKAFLYWEPNGKFSTISEADIVSRFSCTQSKVLTFAEYSESELVSLSRQVINSNLKQKQINDFLSIFRVPKKPLRQKFISNENYEKYIIEQKHCLEGTYKFRVDKIF